jgi:hypothetical protein
VAASRKVIIDKFVSCSPPVTPPAAFQKPILYTLYVHIQAIEVDGYKWLLE